MNGCGGLLKRLGGEILTKIRVTEFGRNCDIEVKLPTVTLLSHYIRALGMRVLHYAITSLCRSSIALNAIFHSSSSGYLAPLSGPLIHARFPLLRVITSIFFFTSIPLRAFPCSI